MGFSKVSAKVKVHSNTSLHKKKKKEENHRCMRQALGRGALGKPRGSGWRGRWEGGSGWGTHVNPWLFHLKYDEIHYKLKNNNNNKVKKNQINNLTLHLKQLEIEEIKNPRVSRRKEIIKIRAEINEK